MQVILTKSVKKLGKVGDIVRVKDGYGRNYLIPGEFAIRATKQNLSEFETRKAELAGQNEEIKKHAEVASNKIAGKNVIFIAQASPDGRLFGSITSKAIAREISQKTEFDLNFSNINLINPIKSTGIYSVEVHFHSDVSIFINIVVAKSDSEAQELIIDSQSDKTEKTDNNNSSSDLQELGTASE